MEMTEQQKQYVMNMASEMVELRLQVKAMQEVIDNNKVKIQKGEELKMGLFEATRDIEISLKLAQRDKNYYGGLAFRAAFQKNMSKISNAGLAEEYNLWKGNFDEIIKNN